jgi:MerR family transcriptional regulator, copper efflux regulator
MATTGPTHTWTMGKAAQAAGLSRKALRVYEAKGLLPATERSDAGYRLYSDDDIAVLRFIRRARTLGLSLDEIGDILDLRRGGAAPCRYVVALLEERIREVDRTITELRRLRSTLADTRASAEQHRRDYPDDGLCRIIEHSGAGV